MSGLELFEQVFSNEIDELHEIEDLDEVSCYDEEFLGKNGWYIESSISFRYRGKKYSFEKSEHSSDNVSDTEYRMNTFQEVLTGDSAMHKAVDKIINYIEEDLYHTWEDIVEDLEKLKKIDV